MSIITADNPTGATLPRPAEITRTGENIMAVINNAQLTPQEVFITLQSVVSGVVKSCAKELFVQLAMRQDFANMLVQSGIRELNPSNVTNNISLTKQ